MSSFIRKQLLILHDNIKLSKIITLHLNFDIRLRMKEAEAALWESCTTNHEKGRAVRSLNIQERNRLNIVQNTLDKQLERELRKLSQERAEFRDVLDHLHQEQQQRSRGNSAAGQKLMKITDKALSASSPDLGLAVRNCIIPQGTLKLQLDSKSKGGSNNSSHTSKKKGNFLKNLIKNKP